VTILPARRGGSPFTSPDVAAVLATLDREGARGIGQSSWGPTGFAFSAAPAEADRLAAIAQRHPRGQGLDIRVCAGFNHGAEIAVESVDASAEINANERQGATKERILADQEHSPHGHPLKHMSPFDVNIGARRWLRCRRHLHECDARRGDGPAAGCDFLAPPKVGARTGMFFGGKNASLALDMLAKAKAALGAAVRISLFADPGGSFTTAAAMLACIEKTLRDKKQRRPQRSKICRVRCHRRARICGGGGRRARTRECHARRL